ncbi:CLUMA_CG005832, isoform A [Clunio marinus]|uniref:CLUMA_CG005832, isoform A n=1 Tax=Clunio marinus TaxID=568069 RepID=A0A1J1HW24_9DIPT|nr:CLUMA_CG005832, isoform A [Clunio marinus]
MKKTQKSLVSLYFFVFAIAMITEHMRIIATRDFSCDFYYDEIGHLLCLKLGCSASHRFHRRVSLLVCLLILAESD